MSGYRLPPNAFGGGLVDRSRPLAFTFDGKGYSGFAGDTLASALLASGVDLYGRSFKYHRPRGLFSAGVEEPSALVTLRSGARAEPNTRATVAELFDGLEASSQNRWPSLGFDVMAVNGLAGPILGAGFYYKTFMGPTAKAWMFYEHRSEEHTSELQSLMRTSYAVFCLKKKTVAHDTALKVADR